MNDCRALFDAALSKGGKDGAWARDAQPDFDSLLCASGLLTANVAFPAGDASSPRRVRCASRDWEEGSSPPPRRLDHHHADSSLLKEGLPVEGSTPPLSPTAAALCRCKCASAAGAEGALREQQAAFPLWLDGSAAAADCVDSCVRTAATCTARCVGARD